MSRERIKALRERFEVESDALWASFKAGNLTHAEYRERLDPLEARLRQDIKAARQETGSTGE